MDKVNGKPLYEVLVMEAKKQQIAGATVLRGILSFGASSRRHSAKLLDLSSDLPIIVEVVEVVDVMEKIDRFLVVADQIIEWAKCGALITVEKAEVIRYSSRK